MQSLIVTLFTLLAVTNSSTIPNFVFKEQEDNINCIIERYEKYYETVPDDLKEDAHLLVPELVQKYGYPCERHTITTNDGYILELHRIPYGKNGPSENRPAVFVQHGLLSSSADWIIPGTEKGFPYVLVDHGYDVWLGNVRGNRYSRKHVSLHPRKDAKKFWDFTWHEIAVFDLPAAIDYVRNYTVQDKIFYIGHSQGTTIAYVMLSKLPEYNNKFRAVFTLAPPVYMKRMFSPLIRILAKFERSMGILAEILGIHEFAPRTEFVAQIAPLLCGDESVLQILCVNAIFALSGFNYKQMNTTLLPVLMGHTPAGAATKQLFHFAQGINSGKFREWDYGMVGNLWHYGNFKPPRYELQNVNAPVYIYYSRNDWFANAKDVERLADEISNLQAKFLVMDKLFNHVDFVIGVDARDLIFMRIIGLMKRH